jgi:xanthine/uracil permease
MIDYEAQIARYANPPNHELEQMIGLGIIIISVVFLFAIKKSNPLLYTKITSVLWGIVGIMLFAWFIGKWKNKD